MSVGYRSPDTVGREPRGGALSLAVRVWFCRIELDRELAEGANPTTDVARGLRARQLASRRCRRQLASGLRLLVKQARQPAQSPWVVTVPLNRRQVNEASELLLMLAMRVEGTEEPCPRALALARFLISDPSSPASVLFDSSNDPIDRATTAQLTRAALEAIDHRPLR